MADLTPVKFRKLTPEPKLNSSKSFTRVRNKSISRVYPSTESTERKLFGSFSSRPSNKPKSVLALLKNRHGSKQLDKASPELAASIIKDYILPLFEADCRQIQGTKRASEKGLFRKALGFEENSGTLYADLKLSDKLSEQLLAANRKNEDLMRQLLDQGQCKESYRIKSEKLQHEVLGLQIKLQLSMNHHDETQSKLQAAALISSKVEEELEEYKALYKASEGNYVYLKEEHIAALGKLESAEYSRLLVTQELELLKTQFEMIAHNMQEISKHMSQIEALRYGGEKVAFEKAMLAQDFRRQSDLLNFLANEYERIYTLRKAEQMSLAMLDGAFTDIRAQRERAIKYLVKKNEKLTRFSDSASKENTELREKVKEMTKKYESLTTEFRKLWKKHTSTKWANSNKQDRCKRCDKFYLEDDNFNWSCRIHTSSFEHFWLCCGKDRVAQGCSLGKHQPLDEIDKLGLTVETAVISREVCLSCKETGHNFVNCPQDPNRIFNLDDPLKTDKIPRRTNLATDSLKILKAKLGSRAIMAKDEMSSPSNASQISEIDESSYDQIEISIRDKLKDAMRIRTALRSLKSKHDANSYSLHILDTSNTAQTEALPSVP